jgi:hypothetical protein
VGLISKSKEKEVWNIGSESQSSALFLCYCDVCIYSGRNYSEHFNFNNEFECGYNSLVDIEVNYEKKATYFFINNKQCPYYISDIYSSSFPLLFGFSSCSSSTIIDIISLFKILPSSSYVDPSFECIPIKWVFLFYYLLFSLLIYIYVFLQSLESKCDHNYW